MIQISLSQNFHTFKLNVDFTLPGKGITAIFGRSGSGKTTLINAISGLSKPDCGRIVVGDRRLFDSKNKICLPPEKRRIGYVFQDARLFPHMTVEKNLKYGVRTHNLERWQTILELLGIGHLLQRYPASLSGGEKQRVGIGRALLSEPELLLMDEPLASLDLPRKRELMPYLNRLAAAVNIPILLVSHSLDEIMQLADHIVMLNNGHVVAKGPLHEIWGSSAMTPWLPVKEHSSLLNAVVGGQHERYPLTELRIGNGEPLWVNEDNLIEGKHLRLRIYANDVSVALKKAEGTSIRNIIPARVCKIVRTPPYVQVGLEIGDECLWANITEWAADELMIYEGDKVFAQVKGVSVAREDMAVEA